MSGDGKRARGGAVRRLAVAASAGLLVTLVGGWFAFGFSLRTGGARKLLSSLYSPGLRVAGHLHVPSFVGWFVLAGVVDWVLYTAVVYALLWIVARSGGQRAA